MLSIQHANPSTLVGTLTHDSRVFLYKCFKDKEKGVYSKMWESHMKIASKISICWFNEKYQLEAHLYENVVTLVFRKFMHMTSILPIESTMWPVTKTVTNQTLLSSWTLLQPALPFGLLFSSLHYSILARILLSQLNQNLHPSFPDRPQFFIPFLMLHHPSGDFWLVFHFQ